MNPEVTLAVGGIQALTALADGTFIAIWNAPGNIPTAQIYNSDGTKKGTSFALAPGASGENINFTATSLSDGRFVVVWQQKAAKDAVYAKVFETNGASVSDAFKIASGDVDQTLPQVTAIANGGFVVATINAGAATVVRVDGDGTMTNALSIQDNALGVSITALKDGNLAAFVDVGGGRQPRHDGLYFERRWRGRWIWRGLFRHCRYRSSISQSRQSRRWQLRSYVGC